MPLLGLVIGALLGALGGRNSDAVIGGAVLGLVVGFVVGALRKRNAAPAAPAPTPGALNDPHIAALLRRVTRLEQALARAGIALDPAPAAVPPASAPAGRDWVPAGPDAVAAPAAVPSPAAPAADTAVPAPAAVPAYLRNDTRAPAPAAASIPATPAAPATGEPRAYEWIEPIKPNPVWAWITGGNTLARVGVLLLFIGVGFLLKYATERYTVPAEFRLAGVAVGAIVLLLLGWRLRHARAGYAMILQGGGVGVLYLTVFAALKLYAMLPPAAAFGLLFAIAALSSGLAIWQNALALAALGVIGGFAAPILTSTNSGSHVMLFSYYALLNAGIFFIAWFRAWRLLNLLGFVCTFVVGTLWGVTRYRPDDFATTEPFLILFFLFYVGIAVAYALRQSMQVRHYVDGTLVFGTPLIAAGLQHGLVRNFEYGMAISAVAAALLYLVLGRVLWSRRREDLRLLVESFLALGIVFATLAVPLALDARWTSATWALEGAAIVVIGLRQGHVAPRVFGLLLQFAAGVAFAAGLSVWTGSAPNLRWPVLNSDFVGAAMVALAGMFCAFAYARHGEAAHPSERMAVPFVFAWGALWWLVAGGREIDRFVDPAWRATARAAFVTGTALAFDVVAQALRWRLARAPAFLLPVALLIVAFEAVPVLTARGDHLFAHGGFVAWLLALAVLPWLQRRAERAEGGAGEALGRRALHVGLMWLLALIGAHELGWVAAETAGTRGTWRLLPWGLVPALVLALWSSRAASERWPFAPERVAALTVGAVPLVLLLAAGSLLANVANGGDPWPLPFVPVLNPLDIVQAIVFLAIAMWARAIRREAVWPPGTIPRPAVIGVPAVLVFVWINAMALRSIHHLAGVAYDPYHLWHSTLVQATLSILWTVVAFASMVVANRKGARIGWTAGAVLLAVVVAKLFLVDLSSVAGLARIVSFIGVGLLLLLIGYVAPVPARRPEEAP